MRFNHSVTDILGKIKQNNTEELKDSYEIIKTYQRQIEQYLQSYFGSKKNGKANICKIEHSPRNKFVPSLPAEFIFDEMNDKELATIKLPPVKSPSPRTKKPAG